MGCALQLSSRHRVQGLQVQREMPDRLRKDAEGNKG